MKKTILALAVPALLAAGVTNAATVYNNDGTKIDLKGSIRLLAEDGARRDADLSDDSSRIGLGINHDLGNGLSGLGYIEMGYDTQMPETNSKSTIKNRLAYAGLSLDGVGTLTAGRITAPFDDVAVSDYTWTYGGVMDFGKMQNNADRGPFGQKNTFLARTSNSVKVESAEFNGFKAAGSYTMKTGDNVTDVDNAYTLAAFYTSDFGLTFNAGYGHGKSNGGFGTVNDIKGTYNAVDADIWGIGAQYEIGDFAIGLDYGQAKLDWNDSTYNNGDNSKANLLGVGVKYQIIEQTKVYAGFYSRDYKDYNDWDRHDLYVVGTDYAFSKNVVTFLEYAHDDYKYTAPTTAIKNDDRIGLGFRVYF
ncbi:MULTISPECIES: porin [Plesiomonas]|uniref:porin n=1 Tax=Plesiomonas TaxID=702 RepID=UPI0012614DE1|nr:MULTISPECIES: porin [Plesiomonas]KAB7674219.1 porin [Plesiomonas shigelloides]KAB7687748.1 porin [Plesiomonas shigelloides]MCE5163172.1 porin [Plesiomonas sp. PI-19]MCQ8858102.1 porin [Plesiomonas shigelloides]